MHWRGPGLAGVPAGQSSSTLCFKRIWGRSSISLARRGTVILLPEARLDPNGDEDARPAFSLPEEDMPEREDV